MRLGNLKLHSERNLRKIIYAPKKTTGTTTFDLKMIGMNGYSVTRGRPRLEHGSYVHPTGIFFFFYSFNIYIFYAKYV